MARPINDAVHFLVLGLGLLVSAPSANAADTRWRNPDGGTFSIGGNWNNGIPGAGDVAHFGLSTPGIFGALPPYTVSFTADATNQALNVEDDRVIFDLNGHFYTTTASSGVHIGTVPGSGGLTVTDGTLSLALGSDLVIGASSSGGLSVSTGGRVIGNPFLLVGGFAAGTLTVQNGGELLANASQIGNGAAATSTATITGASSLLTGQLTIGNFGPGALNITSGGRVGSTDGDIAKGVGGTGSVNVDGTNSRWDNSFDLNVGGDGDGTLNISGGGRVSSDNGFIGHQAGSTGTATIDGANSTWVTSGFMFVGSDGDGTLNVSDGGRVSSGGGIIASGSGGTGTANVNGADSRWDASGRLDVGGQGDGTLNITGGGLVSSGGGLIGNFPGSTGTATIDGANSTWVNADDLEVGNGAAGTLNITAGGLVENANGYVGSHGGDGAVHVDGFNSRWLNTDDLVVGSEPSSTGLLDVANGGRVQANSVLVGSGGSGTMNITAGGLVQNAAGSVGLDGDGTVHVNGLNSRWLNSDDLGVGSRSTGIGLLDVANGGRVQANLLKIGGLGNGTLNISGGGSVDSQESTLGLFSGGTGSVTVAGAGSTWTIHGNLRVGNSGTVNGGVGTLRIQTGGNVDVDDVVVLHDDDRVQLEGGTLRARVIRFLGSTQPFFWTSGRLNVVNYLGSLQIPNGGVLEVGSHLSGALTEVLGAFTQQPGGALEIEATKFGATTAVDKVSVFGPAALGGMLNIQLNDGVVLSPTVTYVIMSAGSISSSFANVANGQRLTTVDGLGSFIVNYGAGSAFDPTQIVLSAFQASVSGDFDLDGDVDGSDFLVWQRGGSPHPNSAADLAAWRGNFGFHALTASAAVIPEPRAEWLAVAGTLIAWGARRRVN